MDLNQITIPSHDVERSVAFYTLLGLRLIVESFPRYARFECPKGDSTFSIHLVDYDIIPGCIIYFETDHLDGEVQRLKKAGTIFIHDPVDQTWLWREARLKDPDGNMVILYHAGENRKNPPWRLSYKKE